MGGHIFTVRGLANLGCLVFLALGILTLLYAPLPNIARATTINLPNSAGYPIISHFTTPPMSNMAGFNIGGINASGQVPIRVLLLLLPLTPRFRSQRFPGTTG